MPRTFTTRHPATIPQNSLLHFNRLPRPQQIIFAEQRLQQHLQTARAQPQVRGAAAANVLLAVIVHVPASHQLPYVTV